MYDSLSRWLWALNPEQTRNPLLNLTDSITNNSQWVFAYSYDVNGNLQARTDARGVVATYTYDALNRNTSITYTSDPTGTPAVSRFYDGWRGGIYNSSIGNGKGRLWQTETSGATGGRIKIDNYDSMGRPTKQEQQFYNSGWGQSYIVQLGYDLAGHVTSMGYPSGHLVTYNYDAAGRLGDKDASQLAFSGNLGDGTSRTYASGMVYDADSRMTKEQLGTTTPIYNKLFYNSRGQLSEIRESTSYTGPTDTSFNRGAIINDYSLQCGGVSCNATDNNGNLTTDTYSAAAVARVYDGENRMTSETQAGSYVAGTYSYDGDGRRVKRKVGAVETWQVYGLGGELIAEYPANANQLNPQKEYGYRNGQLLVTTEAGATSAP